MTGTWMIVLPDGRQNNAPYNLNEKLNLPLIQTLSSPWKKSLITSWTPSSGKLHHHSLPVLGALHLAKRIATNWQAKVKAIKQSFIKAGYPTKLVNDVIRSFENPKSDETIIRGSMKDLNLEFISPFAKQMK